jgi:hypothetical protein
MLPERRKTRAKAMELPDELLKGYEWPVAVSRCMAEECAADQGNGTDAGRAFGL